MTSPVQGGGPVDPSAKPDQTQQPPQTFSETEGATSSKEEKINVELHPIAFWFMDAWGWSSEQALAAEKQFLKNIMSQCQHILNRYKNMYKQLNPDYQES